MTTIKSNIKILLIGFFLLHITVFPQGKGEKSAAKLFNKYTSEAMQMYKDKNYSKSAELFEKAHSLKPDNTSIIYNLSVTSNLSGNKAKALDLLNKLAKMKLVYHPETDSDFVSIWNDDNFKSVIKKFQENTKPGGETGISFKIQESDLITEGIAYYPKTETFYVSSVRKRKILSIDKDGSALDFITSGQDSIWGIFGMAVDTAEGILWVCTSAVPQINNFSSADLGKAGIYKYDIGKKKLLKKYILADDKKHLFGDLTLGAHGKVFVSDSKNNTIYVIDPKKDKLEKFFTSDDFVSLQGIAVSKDSTSLFVADYASGIYKIHISSKKISKLVIPDSICTIGTDGLYCYNGSLIAVQNGISPNRVIRLYLNDSQNSVNGYKIIAANVQPMEDPTLGVIFNNSFHFISNSQWNKVGNNGSVLPDAKWDIPTILRTGLEK